MAHIYKRINHAKNANIIPFLWNLEPIHRGSSAIVLEGEPVILYNQEVFVSSVNNDHEAFIPKKISAIKQRLKDKKHHHRELFKVIVGENHSYE